MKNTSTAADKKNGYILGINGGVRLGYQDVSAVLLRNGTPCAAMEEERINRIKHSPGQLPFLSVKEVLDIEGISIRDVDSIATHGSTWGNAYGKILEEYFLCAFGYSPPVNRYHHHLCHAASAYYASGFDDAIILTADASGDGDSMHMLKGSQGTIKTLDTITRENSLGIFYSMITQFCGFTRDTDEYKLMGLAPYGNPGKIDLSWLIKTGNGNFKLQHRFIKKPEPGAPQPSRQQPMYTQALVDRLGQPRLPGSPIMQYYKDIAAAAQDMLEQVLLSVLRKLHSETGMTKVCMAGGIALNCAANRLIMEEDWLDELYIQPAAGDAGLSLGAAYLQSLECGIAPSPMSTAYLGTRFEPLSVKKQLDSMGLKYRQSSDPAAEAASMIAAGKVVGWFQGRSEFGPRALGNRSILGNALNPGMKEILNHKIKFREGFRPFCPSVLEEDFGMYFRGKQTVSRYMTINYETVSSDIPSVTHVDGTSRIQTVSRSDNEIYYRLLENLKKLTGHGICVNTSFNRSREPIVNSPRDAVSVFYGSGMDALFIENFVLEK